MPALLADLFEVRPTHPLYAPSMSLNLDRRALLPVCVTLSHDNVRPVTYDRVRPR